MTPKIVRVEDLRRPCRMRLPDDALLRFRAAEVMSSGALAAAGVAGALAVYRREPRRSDRGSEDCVLEP